MRTFCAKVAKISLGSWFVMNSITQSLAPIGLWDFHNHRKLWQPQILDVESFYSFGFILSHPTINQKILQGFCIWLECLKIMCQILIDQKFMKIWWLLKYVMGLIKHQDETSYSCQPFLLCPSLHSYIFCIQVLKS